VGGGGAKRYSGFSLVFFGQNDSHDFIGFFQSKPC